MNGNGLGFPLEPTCELYRGHCDHSTWWLMLDRPHSDLLQCVEVVCPVDGATVELYKT